MVYGPNKRSNKNKWGLPAVLNPVGTTPLCVNVPDDPQWIAKFYGAIYNLSIERNWDWNENEDRREVAARWFEVYQDLLNGGCYDMNCQELLQCLYGTDTLRRFNTETGRIEVSTDGGETWEVDETHDPRFIAPRNDTGAINCEAVNFIVGAIQYFVDRQVLEIAAGAGLVGVVGAAGGFLSLLFGITPWAIVGTALATAVTAFTSSAIEAAMTLEVWTRLLCNLLTYLDGDTTVSTADFDAILAKVLVDETGIAATVLWHTINAMGPAGLQNAIALGQDAGFDTGDCEECGTWCYTFDFTASDGGWTVVPGRASTYVGGTGWTEGVWNGSDLPGCANRFYAQINVRKTFADTVVTRIAMTFSGNNGFIDNAAAINNQINGWNDATQEVNSVINENFGTNITQEWTGSELLDKIELQLSVGTRCGSNTGIQSADFVLHTVVIEGEGTNPFGADNC